MTEVACHARCCLHCFTGVMSEVELLHSLHITDERRRRGVLVVMSDRANDESHHEIHSTSGKELLLGTICCGYQITSIRHTSFV